MRALFHAPFVALVAACFGCWTNSPAAAAVEASISADLQTLQIKGISGGKGAEVEVRPLPITAGAAAMLGLLANEGSVLVFTPVLPFVAGQHYRADVRMPGGIVVMLDVAAPKITARAPTVRMLPSGAVFPANALKLYLQFNEPMEQGIFLERLRLLDEQGGEVVGPFRETELWSPDGKRLTIWFHPGRQKEGVNLNEDEGPVLAAGKAYELIVAGIWRSAGGVPLGQDQRLPFTAGPADHDSPDPAHWTITTPEADTMQPLTVAFSESLDPAMLPASLSLWRLNGKHALEGAVAVKPNAAEWHFVPARPWEAGQYEVRVNPELEDLAGNNLIKPFEIDITASLPRPAAPPTALPFSITPSEAPSSSGGR